MLRPEVQLISVDDHVVEPPHADVPDDEAHQIAELHARNFYDFH
jgi:hypothetical protein